jgi:nucleoside-diphosphate-sugar epimerase
VHCAALADDWASRDEALRVNRDGTLEVIARFPGARLVHMSTSSVYDALTPSVNLTESATDGARYLSGYSESKALAEVEAARFGAVILRPHAVYGPGDTTLLPRVLDGVRRGRLVLPEGGDVRHSLTHIDNLVYAVVRALDPSSSPGVYNIADAHPVALSTVLEEFLERRGVVARLVALPFRAAFALAAAAETAALINRTRPRLTRYAVSQLGLERTFDLTAARTHLDYHPTPTTLEGAEHW